MVHFRYLDFVNLMLYDFHGSWESVTGHNAPMYAAPGGSAEDVMRTVVCITFHDFVL